jgi:hypothetical protein
MRIQLLITLLLIALPLKAQEAIDPNKIGIEKLFKNYHDSLAQGDMKNLKQTLTHKTYKEWGKDEGLRSMIESHKTLPKMGEYSLEIKPGVKDKDLFFVKILPKDGHKVHSTYIVIKDKKEFKIKGTMSDSE